MPYMLASDTISGTEGVVTIKVGSETHVAAYVKTMEATFEKTKNEIKVLGRRAAQQKAGGWSGSGSMTIYYVTSLFRNMFLKYAKEGIDTYFDMTIENDDAASTIGKQTVVLKRCNLDSGLLAKLDIDATELDEDLDFTFEDFDISSKFTDPKLQNTTPVTP